MRQSYPKTLLDFERRFQTEAACLDYLAATRWPQGFVCPVCKYNQGWRKGRKLRCGACRRDFSITTGTIFHGSHIQLRLWFRAMWWITNQKSGVNALGLKRLLGLGSYESAWTCLHRLRKAMVRPGREKLSGQVEVDEAFVGGRGHTYRRKNKNTVLIAAEVRGTKIGRIRLSKVYGQSGKQLIGFARQNIEPGSEVLTDGGKGYEHLGSFGYKHGAFPLAGKGHEASNVMLPRVHRVASLLKRWLLGIHQGKVSAKQFAYYLDEFTFRFNRRFSKHRGMLFYRLAQQSMITPPLFYENLIKWR